MAGSILPIPGSEYGPCLGTCDHIDCQETRDMSNKVCVFCQGPIGYEMRFVRRSEYAHELCLELAVENHNPLVKLF